LLPDRLFGNRRTATAKGFGRTPATGGKPRQIRRLRCNLQRHNSLLGGYKSA